MSLASHAISTNQWAMGRSTNMCLVSQSEAAIVTNSVVVSLGPYIINLSIKSLNILIIAFLDLLLIGETRGEGEAEQKANTILALRSRGLVQVWVTKVVVFVPLLEQQRLPTGRFNLIHFYRRSEPQKLYSHRDLYPASLRAKLRELKMVLLKNSSALASIVKFWPKSKLFTIFNKNATISLSRS